MKIKIGNEFWHVEFYPENDVELEVCAKAAWVEHAKKFGIDEKRKMMVAVWSGRGWWAVPVDNYTAQTEGDIVIEWPISVNDWPKIWHALDLACDKSMEMEKLFGYVVQKTESEKRGKFKIIPRNKNDTN